MPSRTLLTSLLLTFSTTIVHAQSGGFARTCKDYYLTGWYGSVPLQLYAECGDGK